MQMMSQNDLVADNMWVGRSPGEREGAFSLWVKGTLGRLFWCCVCGNVEPGCWVELSTELCKQSQGTCRTVCEN